MVDNSHARGVCCSAHVVARVVVIPDCGRRGDAGRRRHRVVRGACSLLPPRARVAVVARRRIVGLACAVAWLGRATLAGAGVE